MEGLDVAHNLWANSKTFLSVLVHLPQVDARLAATGQRELRLMLESEHELRTGLRNVQGIAESVERTISVVVNGTERMTLTSAGLKLPKGTELSVSTVKVARDLATQANQAVTINPLAVVNAFAELVCPSFASNVSHLSSVMAKGVARDAKQIVIIGQTKQGQRLVVNQSCDFMVERSRGTWTRLSFERVRNDIGPYLR